jgi:hypothetical protein
VSHHLFADKQCRREISPSSQRGVSADACNHLLRRLATYVGGLGGHPPMNCWVLLYILALIVFLLPGCTRNHYRLSADRDVYALIEQKTCQPGWPLDDYRIYVDPLSRMYDPGSPDRPPMPPDDPTAHRLMHCIDCKKGYCCWHANGDTDVVENPLWLASLPRDERGVVWLDADAAMRVALLQSPEFQEELEDLYLSALDVSFERFRFDAQFFGGYGVGITSDGRDRSTSGGESGTNFAAGTAPLGRDLQVRKLFATGGELVVGLANSLVWQFSGPNTHNVTSLLDFSLIQPLLRAGGRDVILERLTIAERALLANVRQMERFRRGFYVEIVTGEDAGRGPTRRGGFFGGSGLEGFSGVGGGGFGQVGNTLSLGRGAGAGQAGGFLGLLQDQQNLQNQRSNITALRSSVAQLQAFYRAGRIDFFQVELARQASFNAQSRLLNGEAAFQEGLDDYKADLGLPQQVEIQLDTRMISDFQIIDPLAIDLQNGMTDLQQKIGTLIIEALTPAASDNADTANDEFTLVTSEQLQQQLSHAIDLSTRTSTQLIDRIIADISRLRKTVPDRQLDIRRIRSAMAIADSRRLSNAVSVTVSPGQGFRDLVTLNPESLAELPDKLAESLQESRHRLAALQEQLAQLRDQSAAATPDSEVADLPVDGQQQNQNSVEIPQVLSEISAEILSLTLIQARARTETVRLTPVALPWQAALDVARCYRRDWMNARAQLVDVWRLVQFNANDLESDLDFVFFGDVSNVGDNPLDLRGSTGRLSVGLEFDAPLTRLAERNTYRQALIEYQQARRDYYQFEDSIARGLRSILRTVDVNQLNFELRRAAVNVAIGQVELTRLRLQEPPKPEEEARLGATTARDLVNALAELLDVQNDFLSVWTNQEVQRRVLDFNMGTMQLDNSGLWLDPGPILSNEDSELCINPTGSPIRDANPAQTPPSEAAAPESLPESLGALEMPEEIPDPSAASQPFSGQESFVRPASFWDEEPPFAGDEPLKPVRRLPEVGRL